MANIEEKTIIRARENAKEVDAYLVRAKAYGWTIKNTSKETFENNVVEHITLQRDLSIDKNQLHKKVEEEEDEVERAIDYCDAYINFLDNKISELEEEKKFNPAFLIVLLAYSLFQIIGASVIVFLLPALGYHQWEGTLTMPEGSTLFGMKEISISAMILVVCYTIGALIILIAALILVSKIVQRKIHLAQIDRYEDRRDDFTQLRDNLEAWMPKDFGKFNPYAKGTFKTFEKPEIE